MRSDARITLEQAHVAAFNDFCNHTPGAEEECLTYLERGVACRTPRVHDAAILHLLEKWTGSNDRFSRVLALYIAAGEIALNRELRAPKGSRFESVRGMLPLTAAIRTKRLAAVEELVKHGALDVPGTAGDLAKAGVALDPHHNGKWFQTMGAAEALMTLAEQQWGQSPMIIARLNEAVMQRAIALAESACPSAESKTATAVVPRSRAAI